MADVLLPKEWIYSNPPESGWPEWAICCEPYGGKWEGAYSFAWKAVEVAGLRDAAPWDGNVERLLFGDMPDFQERPDGANVDAHGFLKWDGCLEIAFRDNGAHHCGRRSALRYYESLLTALYAIAQERMPSFNREIAE